MKQQKFRIWDKVEKTFLSKPLVLQHLSVDVWGNPYNLHNGTGKSELDIQWATGLVDMKGVQVFDGDIVWICVSSIVDDERAVKNKMNCLSLVKWNADRLLWEAEAIKAGQYGHTLHLLGECVQPSTRQIEVVGNNLENPELLEKL